MTIRRFFDMIRVEARGHQVRVLAALDSRGAALRISEPGHAEGKGTAPQGFLPERSFRKFESDEAL